MLKIIAVAFFGLAQVGAVQALETKSIGEAQILALLSDASPQVRRAAARSARSMILDQDVRKKILETAARDFDADVRAEAARTLCFVSSDGSVASALVSLAKNDSSQPVRAMAMKALYLAAPQNENVRTFLIDSAKNDRSQEARLGAVWALFSCEAKPEAVSVLLSIASDPHEAPACRVMAEKSLYLAMGKDEVKGFAKKTAADDYSPRDVRQAAIMLLSSANAGAQEVLSGILSRETDPQLKAAAVRASNPDIRDIRTFFHLGFRLQNDLYVSPIDSE